MTVEAQELPNESKLKAMVSLLEDDNNEITDHVKDKLMSFGVGLVPLLENLWLNNELPSETRDVVEDIIQRLQSDTLGDKFLEWKNKGCTDLLEGMMLVANYQFPTLNMTFLSRKIEQYYQEVCKDFQGELDALGQIEVLNNFFYKRLNFRPNNRDIQSPSNNMINKVLETKRGNPLTLSVVYMLIAERLKMPIYGVNLPNLFVVTYKNDEKPLYINVFNKGIILRSEDLDNYIDQIGLVRHQEYYEACSNLDIVMRALRNLEKSYEKLGEFRKSDGAKKLLLALEEVSTC